MGQVADFIGNDGKAHPGLAGARGLHRGIERQDVGLERDFIDGLDDLGDVIPAGFDLAHGRGHGLHVQGATVSGGSSLTEPVRSTSSPHARCCAWSCWTSVPRKNWFPPTMRPVRWLLRRAIGWKRRLGRRLKQSGRSPQGDFRRGWIRCVRHRGLGQSLARLPRPGTIRRRRR